MLIGTLLLTRLDLVAQLAHSTANTPELKPMMIEDFEDESVLDCIGTNAGVTIGLTPKDAVTGKRALEVRVVPFSKHQNQYPTVYLDPKFFTSPIDVSTYSRLAITIKNATEGIRNVWIGWSTLPYNDGGRNFEGDSFVIPGGWSWDCSVPTAAFENNDPSSITLLYIIFRPVEAESVFRVDAIQAVYDPALGSPAEKLKRQARDLQAQLDTLKGKFRRLSIRPAEQAAWRAKLADLDAQVQQAATAAAQAGAPDFAGEFKAARERIGDLTARLGEFFFADKKDFVAWKIDPYVNIAKNQFPAFTSQVVKRIDVRMAGNEFRDSPFMVGACDQDRKLTVKVETGDGLPSAAVEVFETRYLKNRKNQETGEPLYPPDGPLAIPNRASRQITLRFNTRTQTVPPGRHPFKVILRDLDAKIEKVIPGTLEVWNFALPPCDILPCNGYAELDSSEFAQGKLTALAVADMKTFGMNIVCIHPVEMPKIAELDAEDCVIKIDSQAFERRLSQVLKAWRETSGQEHLQFLFSISGMYDLGVKGLDQSFPNARWQKVLAQWLNSFTAILEKYNLTYADWFIVVGDEASEAALVKHELPAAEGLKAADPNVRTINNTSTPLGDPAVTKRFYQAFDILQPHLPEFKSRPALREWIEKSGRPIWTYKCLADWGAKGKNTYEYYRAYGWDLVNYGLTGTGIWTYCAQAVGQQGCGYIMVYKHADREQVVHSRRFEFLREGLDDYRYLWKLKETARGKGPRAVKTANKLIQQAVADVTSHPADTTRADHWRTRIAAEILKLQKHK